ncbi:MAG: hypothetical protein ABJP48_10160 [Erythrobacter sp.]
MIVNAFLAALLALQSTGAAQAPETEASSPQPLPQLSSENRAVVRCSAAFALLAQRQSQGETSSQQWPELGERGREFFVRSIAGLMDDTGLGRPEVASLMTGEAQRLLSADEVDSVMPACLLLLNSSGV